MKFLGVLKKALGFKVGVGSEITPIPLLPTYWDIQKMFGKVLYMEGSRVGMILNTRYYNGTGIAEISVEPRTTEFLETIDTETTKIRKHQVYKTTEFKKHWKVDEIPSITPWRFFYIQIRKDIRL